MAVTQKISVALGRAEASWVKKRASKLKTSVSAIVTEAVRAAQQLEARREVLAHVTDGADPPSPKELVRVRREWG